MKNIVWLTLCIVFSSQAFSQDLTAKQLFRKFKQQTEVTTLSIPGFAAKFGAFFVDNDDAEIKYLIKKMKSLKIAVAESNENQAEQLHKEWPVNQLNSTLYEPLINIEDGTQQIRFLIREKGDVIKELLMFVKDEEETVMLLIDGKFTVQQIKKLVNSIELSELKNVQKN